MGVELPTPPSPRWRDMTAWATARTRGHLAVVDGFRGVVHRVRSGAPSTSRPTRGDLLVVHDASHGADAHVAAGRPTRYRAGRAGRPRRRPGRPPPGSATLVVDVRTATRVRPPPPTRAPVGRHAAPTRPPDAHVDVDLVDELVDALVSVTTPRRLQPASCSGSSGSGVGLTPSGDDAIVGMLAVLHRCAPPSVAAGPLDTLAVGFAPLLDRTDADQRALPAARAARRVR